MSRHEGVSCDACMKANFRGRRYKCLTCYDYDLCSACYESSAVTNQHLVDHPMQCILTKNDFELFHGGESNLTSSHPQSLTCPFCGKMGHTEASLKEHVTSLHPETSSFEVVCPICASVFGGDPNHITDDFGGHLALDHLSGAPRDLDVVSENAARHNVRRISQQTRGFGRGVARQNMRFGDSMDPIAELLSQLSGVRRPPGSDLSPSFPYDQATLRQHIRRGTSARAHGSGLNSNSATSTSSSGNASANAPGAPQTAKLQSNTSALPPVVTALTSQAPTQSSKNQDQQSHFLLSRLGDLEKDQESTGSKDIMDRSDFVQELVLSTLSTDLEEHASSQISVTHTPPPPDTADASTQTSSTSSSIVNAVHTPSLTYSKPQPTQKQPAPKSQKYSYLNSPAQQPLRGLPQNIGINAPQGNGRPPPPDVSSMNKKKPSRGNDGRTAQPPH